MKKSTIKFLALAMFVFMGTFAIAQTQYSITFNVDMTGVEGFTQGTDDLWMSGSFAGWAEPGTDENYKMAPLDAGSMIYTLTVTIDSGEVMYKYFKSSEGSISWANGEWDGDPNRKVYITGDQTFDNVWANKPQDVTFNVDMTPADPFDPAAEQVFIAGSLANGWAEPGTLSVYEMTSEDNVIYSITLSLYPGDYMFKYFIVPNGGHSWDGGEWAGDPNREITVDTIAAEVDDVWGDIEAGIFNEPNEFTYSMYPNPVFNILNIDNTGDVSLVEVFDVSGRLVRTIQVTTEKVTIDVADLQTGVYLVNVTNDKGTQSSKFIKN